MGRKGITTQLSQCKHPNSRKTKNLARKVKRMNYREKNKLGYAVKANMAGERLFWFSEKIEDHDEPIAPELFDELIEEYIHRFDDEVEQITLKQSICKNRSNQHASRLDILKMTFDREHNEYTTCGLEMLNVCDPEQFKSFKEWDGDSLKIQHLKLTRITKKSLINNVKTSNITDEQME